MKKETIAVAGVAFLCGAALICNSYTFFLSIGLIWLVFYLAKTGFVKGILLILLIYMSFDSFVLSYVPSSIFLYAKYLSTGLIFIISVIILLQNYGRLYLLMRVPGIYFIVLYVVTGCISALINNVNLSLTVTALQQELRYIPLFLALAITHFDVKYIKKAAMVILIIGTMNTFIGLVQLCAGKYITPLLLQKSVIVEGELMVAGTVQLLQNAGLIFGVFPSYNVFGVYLTIIFLLIVAVDRYKVFKCEHLGKLGGLVFIIILFTLSRSSIMGALIGYLAILLISRSKKSIPMIILSSGAMIIIFLIGFEARIYSPNPQELPFIPRILEAFSAEGWRTAAMHGRTALMNLTIKTLFDSGSLAFGLGPANWGSLLAWKYSAVYNVIAGSSMAGILDRSILADVNWASILGQFGILGLLFFLAFIISVIRYSYRLVCENSATDPTLKALALAVFGIMIAISLESFFGSWLATRSIAFYIWVLAGFMVSLNNSTKQIKPPDVVLRGRTRP